MGRFQPYRLIRITFRYLNRKNEGDFFDGLPANAYLEEDITKDFGVPVGQDSAIRGHLMFRT